MITTTYREVEITYDENKETWNCEVNENYRSRVNLKDCKNAIDIFIDGKEKLKKKFDRFEVIRQNHHWEWEKITVTSVTYNGVWVVDEKGNREKVSEYACRSMFLYTVENNATIEIIKQKEAERKNIDREIEQLTKSLTFLDLKQFLKQLD